jgi:acetoacetyl-CoA synthetase
MWQPSDRQITDANMTAFQGYVNENYNLQLNSFDELYAWSISEIGLFWEAVARFSKVIFSVQPDTVVEQPDKMENCLWFSGARMNFAENLLRFRDDRIAILGTDERGRRVEITYADLYVEVAKLSRSFREHGITAGDTIAGYLPNIPETVIAMLAASSIGAIWSSTSPDFGVQGVVDRFGQINPRIIIASDGYSYGGKSIDTLPVIRELTTTISSIEVVVIVPFLSNNPNINELDNVIGWEEFLAVDDDINIEFEQLPFDHPLYIMYSSGTTGLPKSIVHGAGGTLLQHLKELALHTDLHREDKIFYFTTCGWMMWNWLVSSLSVGATVVLYDGSPTYPKMDRLFDLIESEKITVFGTSAKFISALQNSGMKPIKSHDLSPLRAILSTGSPLTPELFDYSYEHIKADLCLSSISGGTDIVSCFALGNPMGSVWRGELQTRGLGMAVEVFDPDGNSVMGQKGELVCTKPFPSMPIYFWNDSNGEKYHNAYFNRFDNVWYHGDFAEVTEHDGMIIHGRSDAVLNPGGVRIGTAEIYRIVESDEDVVESICIGQTIGDDVRVVLFVVLTQGLSLDDDIRLRLKRDIREKATPRHVPAVILQVTDIPRTINGKITEIAVREIVHGEKVLNIDALANPQALEQFKDLAELKIE